MRSLLWTHRRRDESGAAAVEFGLIAMVLFLLLFGIIQYGLYFWGYQSGSHAAREGARRAAVAPECTSFDAYVEDRVGGAASGAVTATKTHVADPLVGDEVEVTVSFDVINLNLPLLPLPSGGTITEVAKTRIENVPSAIGVC